MTRTIDTICKGVHKRTSLRIGDTLLRTEARNNAVAVLKGSCLRFTACWQAASQKFQSDYGGDRLFATDQQPTVNEILYART
jgi:hypothetical protein